MPDHSDGDNIWNGIYGHQGAKVLLSRALKQGDVHVLLVGPPGSGKSTMMNALEEHVPGVVYRDTKEITATALQATLKKDPPILLLDEFDKGQRDVYDTLNLPMEQGRVVKDTATESFDVKIGTQIIASANTPDRIPNYIRSRFRDIEFEAYTAEEFVEVCSHMLPVEIGWVTTETEAKKVAHTTLEIAGDTDPRTARDIADLCDHVEDVPTVAKAISDPDARVGEVSLAPSEIARAKDGVEKDNIRERVREEMERAADEDPDETEDDPLAELDASEEETQLSPDEIANVDEDEEAGGQETENGDVDIEIAADETGGGYATGAATNGADDGQEPAGPADADPEDDDHRPDHEHGETIEERVAADIDDEIAARTN